MTPKIRSHVRKLLGYKRLEHQEIGPLINDLCKNEYSLLRNHFYPTYKLDKKIMVKTRHRRIYGDPETPYSRVMNSEHVDDKVKQQLKEIHETLDPIELKTRMERKLKKIFALHKKLSKKRESIFVA